ncbi:MAG: multiubiquitin domain-containing protein [Actinomycetia bacterium]|nr:multiubiquitin domain-containing protein [Actinomycetes bacterium]
MEATTENAAARAGTQPTPVVINGRRVKVPGKSISYKEVVELAFGGKPPAGKETVFTVTYRGGPRPKPQGTLAPGQSVELKPEMVFNVTPADKS